MGIICRSELHLRLGRLIYNSEIISTSGKTDTFITSVSHLVKTLPPTPFNSFLCLFLEQNARLIDNTERLFLISDVTNAI